MKLKKKFEKLSYYKVCRKLGADIWGDLLFNNKPPIKLLRLIYGPRSKLNNIFDSKNEQGNSSHKRKLLSEIAIIKRDQSKFAAFYKISSLRIKDLILRQKGLKIGTLNPIIEALEAQIHIILFRAQVVHHKLIKTYLKEKKINVNFKPVNGIAHIICPGDLITLNFFPLLLIERMKKRMLRLHESHLLLDYKAGSIVTLPEKRSLRKCNNKPFTFFKAENVNLINYSER